MDQLNQRIKATGSGDVAGLSVKKLS